MRWRLGATACDDAGCKSKIDVNDEGVRFVSAEVFLLLLEDVAFVF